MRKAVTTATYTNSALIAYKFPDKLYMVAPLIANTHGCNWIGIIFFFLNLCIKINNWLDYFKVRQIKGDNIN